ncbi:4'-phosphopantetheinyl transferase family protein [Flavobacterium johnsoniae]|uniref:Phosphopantetheinyl transferase n=1 Tax=Flavobacterium johnsoniae TaxID=986 RepID=A0A1J7BPC4_FLAJO|nr:4'-phosphopantetheinyl transferase superfamily protein [Flavobacterium johnsoniae]OIV40429.1 phosphopantetheinyl transferase [Flavobacterium johnsoniae]
MIGNDVIDLLQSRRESNWQRKGFIEKLFTLNEQLLISHAKDPELMVWILWSMKEAAYKVYNRKTKIREYIPKKLVCSLESKNLDYINRNVIKGNVICSEDLYYTKTILSNNSIHTIAVSILDDLDKVIEIEKQSIIKDQNGIPFLISSQNKKQDVSISNHGRFEKVVTIS